MPFMGKSKVLYAVTGLFVVLFAAGTVALGTVPKSTDSGAVVVKWFTDHASNLRWAVWFNTLAGLPFAVWAALVSRRLAQPHRAVFFFGALSLAIESALQSWFTAGLALHASSLDPATARTLLDISSFWGPVLTASTMLMFGSFAHAALSKTATSSLPRWAGFAVAVVFVEQLLETVTILSTRGFTAPGGPMNLMVGAGLSVAAFVCIAIAAAKASTKQPS